MDMSSIDKINRALISTEYNMSHASYRNMMVDNYMKEINAKVDSEVAAMNTNLVNNGVNGAAQVARGAAIGLGIAGAGIAAAQPRINRNGNLNSNNGNMGIKKPFLLIKRNEGFNPDNDYVGNIEGKPSNMAVSKLSACKGYTVVSKVKLVSNCTDAEKEMIENMLKKGVYL